MVIHDDALERTTDRARRRVSRDLPARRGARGGYSVRWIGKSWAASCGSRGRWPPADSLVSHSCEWCSTGCLAVQVGWSSTSRRMTRSFAMVELLQSQVAAVQPGRACDLVSAFRDRRSRALAKGVDFDVPGCCWTNARTSPTGSRRRSAGRSSKRRALGARSRQRRRSPANAAAVHGAGLELGCYTVNDPARALESARRPVSTSSCPTSRACRGGAIGRYLRRHDSRLRRRPRPPQANVGAVSRRTERHQGRPGRDGARDPGDGRQADWIRGRDSGRQELREPLPDARLRETRLLDGASPRSCGASRASRASTSPRSTSAHDRARGDHRGRNATVRGMGTARASNLTAICRRSPCGLPGAFGRLAAAVSLPTTVDGRASKSPGWRATRRVRLRRSRSSSLRRLHARAGVPDAGTHGQNRRSISSTERESSASPRSMRPS